MQLFSSIHTISSWVNSLAVHPASFPPFWKSHLHGYICSRGNPTMSNGALKAASPVWRITSRPFRRTRGGGAEGRRRDWPEAGSGTRERRKRRVPSSSAERRRLMPGNRLVGWQGGWALKAARWKNKDPLCQRQDRINQNKQPQTPTLWCSAWEHKQGRDKRDFGVPGSQFM